MSLATVSLRDLSWAAGLFEGEGCLFFQKARTYQTASMKLGMTDKDVVTRFHAVVGLGNICPPRMLKSGKQLWMWQVVGFANVQAIVAAFWNYLGDRRKAKAEEVLLAARKQVSPPWKRSLCIRGHRLVAENMYQWVSHTGKARRTCRLCDQIRNREYLQRKRAQI